MALGLQRFVWASPPRDEGLLSLVLCGRLCGGCAHCSGVSFCRARAPAGFSRRSVQTPWSWLRGSGIEPPTPALSGGFLSTAPPGKSTPAVCVVIEMIILVAIHKSVSRRVVLVIYGAKSCFVWFCFVLFKEGTGIG